jgi:excisionase family DNA binding protein
VESEKLVMTVIEAGRALDLSRNAAYEAARRGDIPTIRIGKRLLVPRAALERMLVSAETKVASGAR